MDNEHWKTIEGMFDYAAFYDKIVEMAPKDAILIELGTWLGMSTCYLAQKIKESGKTLTFYACDLFTLPEGKVWSERCSQKNFYSIFLDNLKQQDVSAYVKPIIKDAIEFSQSFKDNSVYFLFLDDTHTEEHVYKELTAWLPKIRNDGIISGHELCLPHIKAVVKRFTKENNLTYEIDVPNDTWTINLQQRS